MTLSGPRPMTPPYPANTVGFIDDDYLQGFSALKRNILHYTVGYRLTALSLECQPVFRFCCKPRVHLHRHRPLLSTTPTFEFLHDPSPRPIRDFSDLATLISYKICYLFNIKIRYRMDNFIITRSPDTLSCIKSGGWPVLAAAGWRCWLPQWSAAPQRSAGMPRSRATT